MSTSDRAHWVSRVVRAPFSEEEERADADFWDRIPFEERARVTWELSMELHLLAACNAGESTTPATPTTEAELERRLPRAALRIERR